MPMSDVPRIEYVEARRVLLDVLSALRQQLDAVVLVGAQAVYLRTAGRLPTYQPFTTLGDRLAKPERLDAKDAGDVYRLFDLVAPDDMATRLQRLLADERSTAATAKAIAYGDVLFGTTSGTGVRLGSEALRATIPAPTVTAVLTGYWRALGNALRAAA